MASEGARKKRKQWKDADMVAAMEAVARGDLTVSRAAVVHSVPRKTLNNHVKGRVVHGTKPGGDTILTDAEDKTLCTLCTWSREGFL